MYKPKMNKREFDKNMLGDKKVVLCKTIELAKELFAEAHWQGYELKSGSSYIDTSIWNLYQDKTCIDIAHGDVCNEEYAKRNDFKIVNFEGFESNLSNLKGSDLIGWLINHPMVMIINETLIRVRYNNIYDGLQIESRHGIWEPVNINYILSNQWKRCQIINYKFLKEEKEYLKIIAKHYNCLFRDQNDILWASRIPPQIEKTEKNTDDNKIIYTMTKDIEYIITAIKLFPHILHQIKNEDGVLFVKDLL